MKYSHQKILKYAHLEHTKYWLKLKCKHEIIRNIPFKSHEMDEYIKYHTARCFICK